MSVVNLRKRVEPATRIRSVYFDAADLDAVERLAQDTKRSVSFYVREALRQYLQQSAKGSRG